MLTDLSVDFVSVNFPLANGVSVQYLLKISEELFEFFRTLPRQDHYKIHNYALESSEEISGLTEIQKHSMYPTIFSSRYKQVELYRIKRG